ncbi:hypothetical protein [Streptomyces genisteinicus]|uniref:Uncharacterized protein n=1 Tax=Streptomyces genisteinicus TaxID=2768068 RepID=A0A7H0HN23_9ACTN|nr:hypothetical protein [Streptomyces genisteinicus]QNP61939.1 hypothetical protein IAG43_02705 [Streptomyces genisteinicus]
MSTVERAIEQTADEYGLSVATVRRLLRLCEGLRAEHGDAWTHRELGALVERAVLDLEPWALEWLAASHRR